MNTRVEWLDNDSSLDGLFYSKEETIESVKTNYNIRRYYSAEGITVLIDGIEERVIVQDHTNPINDKKTDKRMLVPIDTVSLSGSYVEYRNEIWIIVSNINIVDDAYKTCQIQKCNYTIKWQNEYGEILEYPCITSNRTFNQDQDKTITLGENQKSILLPWDENTSNLTVDKRMYIDRRNKTPYAIINDIDTTTYNYGSKGLIYFVMEQSVSEHDDRDDLGVCNYKEKEINPIPLDFLLELNVSKDLIIGSTPSVFVPVLKNNGEIVSSWSVYWSFDFGDMDESKFKITYDNYNCLIQVIDKNYKTVNKTLIVKCKDLDSGTETQYNALIIM